VCQIFLKKVNFFKLINLYQDFLVQIWKLKRQFYFFFISFNLPYFRLFKLLVSYQNIFPDLVLQLESKLFLHFFFFLKVTYYVKGIKNQ